MTPHEALRERLARKLCAREHIAPEAFIRGEMAWRTFLLDADALMSQRALQEPLEGAECQPA